MPLPLSDPTLRNFAMGACFLVLAVLLALLVHVVTGHGEDQALKDSGASDLDQFDHGVME